MSSSIQARPGKFTTELLINLSTGLISVFSSSLVNMIALDLAGGHSVCGMTQQQQSQYSHRDIF
jgi:hypothetical protein